MFSYLRGILTSFPGLLGTSRCLGVLWHSSSSIRLRFNTSSACRFEVAPLQDSAGQWVSHLNQKVSECSRPSIVIVSLSPPNYAEILGGTKQWPESCLV